MKLNFEWHSEQNTTGKHNSKFQIVQYCTIHFSEISNTTQQHNYSLTIVLCCVVPTTGLMSIVTGVAARYGSTRYEPFDCVKRT